MHAFYVDDLYDRAFVRPVRLATRAVRWTDDEVVLGAVLGTGRGARWLSGAGRADPERQRHDVPDRPARRVVLLIVAGVVVFDMSELLLPAAARGARWPARWPCSLLPRPGRRAAGRAARGRRQRGSPSRLSVWARGRRARRPTSRGCPSLGLRFHLGIDGISSPLVLLTACLTLLCMVYLLRVRPEAGRPRALVGLLLLLEVGMLGTFVALDLLLFFVFFEVVLVPMWFVIAQWGDDKVPGGRVRAANVFILYTLLGSAVMLLGILLVGLTAGTFDIVELTSRAGAGMSHRTQVLAFLALALGLAVKTPMWPLHSWLPDAHTAAPTVGSVLLAGVLLKMGTYGLVRIAVPIVPDGAQTLAPFLGALAVVGILYGSLACLAQRDLKRLIAFSSVGHMGFVLLGISTLTAIGINGALFANVAHGLITGLLFFLAGAIKDRHHTADLDLLGGGLYERMPRLGGLLAFAAVASLGLPGLAGSGARCWRCSVPSTRPPACRGRTTSC